MKLSISNLAWENKNEKKIFKLLKKYNFLGIEILPTKIWGSWENITKKKVITYKKFLDKSNIEVSSIQSLFYNTNLLLERSSDKTKIIKHFKKLIMIATHLRCKNMVFGSPSFRRIQNSNAKNIEKKLIDILHTIKRDLKKNNITISIEPNPKIYGCNFINNLRAANNIIKKVKSENVKIQLDSACVLIEGGTIREMSQYLHKTNHIHLSEKNLLMLDKKNDDIKKLIKLLKEKKWQKWISIEMMNVNLKDIENSMKFVRNEIIK
tara:strand:- start:48 stop:842 length:795 start_codon:yes stop_codon:yes gene_type:complete